MTLLTLQAYRLFRNELEALMGRKPTKEEIRTFMKAVYDDTGDEVRLSDIFSVMYDYLHDNYKECNRCGEYHLRDNMHNVDDEFDDGEYYCEDCIANAIEDSKFDIHAEHGTDGCRHTI